MAAVQYYIQSLFFSLFCEIVRRWLDRLFIMFKSQQMQNPRMYTPLPLACQLFFLSFFLRGLYVYFPVSCSKRFPSPGEPRCLDVNAELPMATRRSNYDYSVTFHPNIIRSVIHSCWQKAPVFFLGISIALFVLFGAYLNMRVRPGLRFLHNVPAVSYIKVGLTE